MNRRFLLALLSLVPLGGMCQERYVTPAIQITPQEFIRVTCQLLVSPDGAVSTAAMNIVIGKTDKKPVALDSIEQVQVFATNGSKIAYRDNNPASIELQSFLSGVATFVAKYDFVNTSDFNEIGKVVFRYRGEDYEFSEFQKVSM